jgi:signal transduction histidine kinase
MQMPSKIKFNNLQTEFIASLNHEINTPLNSIIGFSELLFFHEYNAEERKEFAQYIQNSGVELISKINHIMDISRLNEGEMVINKKIVSANTLLLEIQNEYLKITGFSGIDLRFNTLYPAYEVFIECDAERIKLIIDNLIKNAIKPSGQGTIEIGMMINDSFIQFYVKDTCKMSKQHSKYNGLCLSISKILILHMGGEFLEEDIPGNGTAFYFTIPLYHPIAS